METVGNEASSESKTPIASIPFPSVETDMYDNGEYEDEYYDDGYNPYVITYCYSIIICSVLVIKSLPPYEELSPEHRRRCLLPPKPEGVPKYTLVLDLDETLVHCWMDYNGPHDLIFPVSEE